MLKGKLIVFEGIDGSGKTTQIKMLHEFLRQNNILVTMFREPGGTPLGETIRKILLSRDELRGGLGETAEFMLFAAARAELTRLIIQPLLNQGITVLLDRFTLSSVCYQGYGRDLSVPFIQDVNRKVTDDLKIDLLFLMDINPEKALNRISGESDRIEKKGINFFRAVRKGYLKEVTSSAKNTQIVDASNSIDSIFKSISTATRNEFEIG